MVQVVFRTEDSREVAVDREGSIDIDIFVLARWRGVDRLELVRHVRPGWHAGLAAGQPTTSGSPSGPFGTSGGIGARVQGQIRGICGKRAEMGGDLSRLVWC